MSKENTTGKLHTAVCVWGGGNKDLYLKFLSNSGSHNVLEKGGGDIK